MTRKTTARTDDIGDRGQWLFCLLMTVLCDGRSEPYFRPRFLGDKFPTFDYLVELVGKEAYFFFVQVKTTRRSFGSKEVHRLKLTVAPRDIVRMVASPVPTYVVGIDEPGGVGYIVSVNEPMAPISSLPMKHPLDCKTLKKLWQEVHDFWSDRNMVLKGSRFAM